MIDANQHDYTPGRSGNIFSCDTQVTEVLSDTVHIDYLDVSGDVNNTIGCDLVLRVLTVN